jgi:8-oxo-dGTP pyrophosphatase MutT (NUDIX family)
VIGSGRQDKTPPVPRQAGRAILMDASGRVLLIHFAMPRGDGIYTFWATPGGGLEPGENAMAAVKRELLEELGLDLALHGPVHTAVGIFEYDGVMVENTDTFFLGRCDITPALQGAMEHERMALLTLRWWTPGEIEETDEDVYPSDLAEVLRRLTRLFGGEQTKRGER